MKRFNKHAIGLALALSAILTAPQIPAQSFKTASPLGELEQSMESNLTWNLQNALLVYYPETKFVVNAKVKIKKVRPKPRLPRLPDALLSKDLTNLPGLPYLPEDLVKPGQTSNENSALLEQVSSKGYEIERIWVNVLVDQSLQQSDWAFIRRFVNLSANLEPDRGDQVRIEGLDFPERAEFAPPQSNEPEAAVQPPVAMDTKSGEAALPAWFPYAFAAGLAVLLIAMFFMGLRSVVKAWKAPSVVPYQTQVLAPPDKVATHDVETSQSKSDDTEKSGDSAPEFKAAVIDSIVGTPAASAAIFCRWIDEQGDGGYVNTAIVITAISKSMLDLVEPHLGQEISETVQQRIANLEQTDVDQNAPRLFRDFDSEVRKHVMMKKYDANDDSLSFLHQMTDDQLQHLLKPLKHGVIAIVLAQLRTNRAARLLDKMDGTQRKTVLAAMGNIDRIPSDVYQHIARQLAGRATELKWMRYVRANGVDTLVKVLDYMDEDSQNEALDYLQTQDVTLARKVNKHFMTFNQFIAMPQDRLRDVAVEVDRDMLAKSLVSLDDEVVENIINSLPEKLAELVRASLDSNIHISDDEVTAARRSLMRAVRGKKPVKVVS